MSGNTDTAADYINVPIVFIPAIMCAAIMIGLYLFDLYDKERSSNLHRKKIFIKYYTASFKFTDILNKLDNYDGVMEAFETIHSCYKSYNKYYCMHGWYDSCQKCQKIADNCRFQFVSRDIIGIWLRVYNPIEINKNLGIFDRLDINDSIPFINPVPKAITNRTENTTIKHHNDIKPIVIKLQQAYNKYYNKLHRNAHFKRYKPNIMKYFKQYQEDDANIIRLALCVN